MELIKRCINACVEAGVKRYIPGVFGSNSGSRAAREAVSIFEKKWAVVKYLKKKEGKGLEWTGVIREAFFDWYRHSPSFFFGAHMLLEYA